MDRPAEAISGGRGWGGGRETGANRCDKERTLLIRIATDGPVAE